MISPGISLLHNFPLNRPRRPRSSVPSRQAGIESGQSVDNNTSTTGMLFTSYETLTESTTLDSSPKVQEPVIIAFHMLIPLDYIYTDASTSSLREPWTETFSCIQTIRLHCLWRLLRPTCRFNWLGYPKAVVAQNATCFEARITRTFVNKSIPTLKHILCKHHVIGYYAQKKKKTEPFVSTPSNS